MSSSSHKKHHKLMRELANLQPKIRAWESTMKHKIQMVTK